MRRPVHPRPALAASHRLRRRVRLPQERTLPRCGTKASLTASTTRRAWALAERGISGRAARRYGIRWDADDDAWVLPIRDPDTGAPGDGRPRRPVRAHDRGTPKSRTLFGLDAVPSGSTLYLVEDALDAAVLLTAGYPGGVASFGASVSQRQAELLGEHAGTIVLHARQRSGGPRRAAQVAGAPVPAARDQDSRRVQLRQRTRRKIRARWMTKRSAGPSGTSCRSDNQGGTPP